MFCSFFSSSLSLSLIEKGEQHWRERAAKGTFSPGRGLLCTPQALSAQELGVKAQNRVWVWLPHPGLPWACGAPLFGGTCPRANTQQGGGNTCSAPPLCLSSSQPVSTPPHTSLGHLVLAGLGAAFRCVLGLSGERLALER